MKTFYSILSVNINPEIVERISIGMLMTYGESVFYHYSKHKLSLIKKLIGKTTYKATLNYLKLIGKCVGKREDVFSEQYIDYLSRYNNNLVSFSKLKFLEIEGTETVFWKLFTKFINENF